MSFFRGLLAAAFIGTFAFSSASFAHGNEASKLYWLKVKAADKFERTALESSGVSIEIVDEDFVVAIGSKEQHDQLKAEGKLITGFEMQSNLFDFPAEDEKFHNYTELQTALEKIATDCRDIVTLDSIGQSVEGRQMFHLRFATNQRRASQKPGMVLMGGHHAREHLSIEIPLMIGQFLCAKYREGNKDIVRLIENRDIHIIPMVNPDGAEYDIADGEYMMWRKNRRKNRGGSFGVDLNRNYGYLWGTGGSSKRENDETYMGTEEFSEPETQAIKRFIEANENISILLSMHTFSELILYPWGHTYDSIKDERDLKTYETMAKTMAKWNDYTPQQSSDLYITSGDTTDWAYGVHKIFSFTFELDPASMWDGGFYPGQKVIDNVFEKNVNPVMYLIDLADNPYRAIESSSRRWGLNALEF